MVVSRGLLQVLQSLLAEGDSHLIPALGGVLDHQVVQGSQTSWDLVASLLGCSHGGAVVLVLHCGGHTHKAKFSSDVKREKPEAITSLTTFARTRCCGFRE